MRLSMPGICSWQRLARGSSVAFSHRGVSETDRRGTLAGMKLLGGSLPSAALVGILAGRF
jgi:hypothetical protein